MRDNYIRENPFVPNPVLLKTLSLTIKEERKKKQLTQESLANKSGINWRYLQKIETNSINMSVAVFINIANGLELSPVKLLDQILTNSKSNNLTSGNV